MKICGEFIGKWYYIDGERICLDLAGRVSRSAVVTDKNSVKAKIWRYCTLGLAVSPEIPLTPLFDTILSTSLAWSKEKYLYSKNHTYPKETPKKMQTKFIHIYIYIPLNCFIVNTNFLSSRKKVLAKAIFSVKHFYSPFFWSYFSARFFGRACPF